MSTLPAQFPVPISDFPVLKSVINNKELYQCKDFASQENITGANVLIRSNVISESLRKANINSVEFFSLQYANFHNIITFAELVRQH